MLCEYYNHMTKESSSDQNLKDVFCRISKSRLRARREVLKSDKDHVLFAIRLYSDDGEMESVQIHRNAYLTDNELDGVIRDHPNAYFDVLHKGTCEKACKELIKRESQREVRTITLKEANSFVNAHHRHHSGTVGCKFSVGLFEADRLIGVAICGRPVSRHLDNGSICEINRLCTLGDMNACSQLYSACARIAEAMGYKKIITYILQSENGASLKASNFVCEGIAGGVQWTGERNRGQNIPHELKTRWSKEFN